MSEIYRVKIKRDGSFEDIGHIVLNGDGTGFCLLDMLPRTVLYIEKKKGDSLMPDRPLPDSKLSTNPFPTNGEPEE